jgi:hypothetical protein
MDGGQPVALGIHQQARRGAAQTPSPRLDTLIARNIQKVDDVAGNSVPLAINAAAAVGQSRTWVMHHQRAVVSLV